MNNFSAFGRGLIGWNKLSAGLASGSKNPIRQVVSHELKINWHGFLGSLLPPPRAPQLSTDLLYGVFFCDRRPQLDEKGKEKKKRGKNNWSEHGFARPSRPRHGCHLKMFLQCFTIQFFFRVRRKKCELDGKQGKMWLRHLSWAALASCHRAPRRCPHPPPREPFHKRLN